MTRPDVAGWTAADGSRAVRPTRFWSEQPGTTWEDGLAIGDGSTGVLLWGTPDRHLLTLSHEDVLLPTDPIRNAPDLQADLSTFRHLIDSGNAQQAADMAVARSREQGYPGLQWTDPLVPVAAVGIIPPVRAGAEYENYRREVISGGCVRVSWDDDTGSRSITAFVSRADHVTVVELRGFGKAGRSLELQPPENHRTATAGVRGGNAEHVTFRRRGGADHLDALETVFSADWDPDPQTVLTSVHSLSEEDDTCVFAVELAVDPEADAVPGSRTSRLQGMSFGRLYQRHLDASRAQVNIVGLDLRAEPSGLSTESLLSTADPARRLELLQLQFGAAQHLVADSTGRFPPTLQGVWSGTFDPAWSSDYTMNGNVQNGSIAAMLPTGNPAQLETYLRLLEGFAADFTENSRLLFGTSGLVLPSRCSHRHGRSTHFDAQHCHEFWTAGGAWAAAFFLDHACYTADLTFLRDRAYPFACAVETFYEDFLLFDEVGTVVFSPSYSPENRSTTFKSQACRNATMDRAALGVLLRGLLWAADLLGIDADVVDRRRERLTALPPYRIAPDGTLAEWLDDGVVENVGHRTASQLLGLWFEPDPDLTQNVDLRRAVHTLIDTKLAWRAGADGVEEMAYGLVQLGLAAAATGHGAGALECVDRLSRLYFRPSLTTTHDVGAIFNVDIAGGLPALVCAMLIGSPSAGRISVLPALPPEWPAGAVEGIHLRGALVVHRLEWSPREISVVIGALPGSSELRRGRPVQLEFPAGWKCSGPTRPPLADGMQATVSAQYVG